MARVEIRSPAPGSTVESGQQGALQAAVFCYGIMDNAGTVDFEVKTGLGVLVLGAPGIPLSDGLATLPYAWPAEPGLYTLKATARGVVYGELGTQTSSFYVRKAPDLFLGGETPQEH